MNSIIQKFTRDKIALSKSNLIKFKMKLRKKRNKKKLKIQEQNFKKAKM